MLNLKGTGASLIRRFIKNEQSLQLLIKKLQDGDSREIVKYLYRPLDIFSYREMKFFVHGDENDLPGSVSYYEDENNHASEVYFRFGSDSLNFYEYRQPVRAGWNEVSIEFADLTPIKQKSPNLDSLFTELIPGLPGHSYGVRGKPTLTRITFFTIGVLNPKNPDGVSVSILDAVSGDIWINELRVLGADDSPGWAYSASSSLRLADLLSVSFNMSQTDPNFHKLAQRFGSRVDSKNWGMSVDFDVIKVLPFNMTGSNLRVNYSHTESISKPVYLPGTDIQVEEASQQLENQLISEGVDPETAQKSATSLRTDAQTLNISDTWNVSNIKFKVPSNKWYWRDFLNSIVLGFNYNNTKGRNPTTIKTSSWVWNASAKYSLSFSKDYFFYPAEIPILGSVLELFEDYRNVKFYYTPQTFDAGVSANRKRSFNQSRNDNALPNVQRDFTAKRNASFLWKLTDGGIINPSVNYNLDISSSLAYLLTTVDGLERDENEIWNDVIGGEMFGEDFRYNQNFDFRTNPKLPTLWDLNKFFTVTAGYGVTYNWQNNFQEEDLGRSAGFSSNIKFGVQLRWKSLFTPLFKESGETTKPSNTTSPQGRSRGRERNVDAEVGTNNRPPQRGVEEGTNESDTTKVTPADSVQIVQKEPIFLKALEFMKSTVRYLVIRL